jgi:hypothetical protein
LVAHRSRRVHPRCSNDHGSRGFTAGRQAAPITGSLRAAYHYAGITLVIVMAIAHTQRPWIVALHRFVEISVGLAVGLILTAVWPERQTIAA